MDPAKVQICGPDPQKVSNSQTVHNQERLSSFSSLIQRALLALREQRFPDAVEMARAALKIQPRDEQAHMILAQALDSVGKSEEAAEIIADLLRKAPNRPELIFALSSLLTKAGRPDEALPLAERYLKIRPESSEAHEQLGLLLAALGRPEEGIQCIRRAVKLNPNFPPHQYNLALSLIQLGQDTEAIQVLRKMLTTWPKFAQGYMCLGDLALKQGDYVMADESARKAIALQPGWAEPHLLLARVLNRRETSDIREAGDQDFEQHIRQAVALDPNSSTAHCMWGSALQDKGQFDLALAEYETSLRLNAGQGAAYFGLASSRKYGGGDQLQVSRFEDVLKTARLELSDQAFVHYGLGKIHEDMQDFESSLRHYDAANALMFKIRSPRRPFDRERLERDYSRVIETFDGTFFDHNRDLGCGSELPLIVLGMMRSGTTLVEQILSSHPAVTGAGELTFWRDHADLAMNKETRNLELAQVGEISEAYVDLLRRIGPTSRRVTDKMPQNTLFLGLIHAIFPKAKIIHVKRHPVDTCLSIYTTPYTVSPDFAHEKGNIVFAYQLYLRLMAHWRTVIPSSCLLEVDYEDLVNDREGVTRRMVEFSGLEWNDSALNYEQNTRQVKTPSRWQVRQPIYKSSVSRWKNFAPWLGEFSELLTAE